MNDLFISSDEIRNELKEIKSLGFELSRRVSLLDQNIKYIISKIKDSETIEAAQDYFNLLDEIQSTLAVLVFTEEIMIPDRLREFVSKFDNIEHDKSYLFKEIKKG